MLTLSGVREDFLWSATWPDLEKACLEGVEETGTQRDFQASRYLWLLLIILHHQSRALSWTSISSSSRKRIRLSSRLGERPCMELTSTTFFTLRAKTRSKPVDLRSSAGLLGGGSPYDDAAVPAAACVWGSSDAPGSCRHVQTLSIDCIPLLGFKLFKAVEAWVERRRTGFK